MSLAMAARLCREGHSRPHHILLALGLLVLAALALQPDSANAGPASPANDDFANAAIVGEPLPFSDVVDTTVASREPSEPFEPCFGYDLVETVWYSFTPSTDVVVTVDTFGSDFSAKIVTYVGESLKTLVPVTCPGYPLQEVIFPVSAGVTYSIQVGGSEFSPSGSLSFQMTVKPPPVKGNDDFADSVLIPEPLPFSNTQNVRGATLEAGEPRSCLHLGSTVWYSFTPSTDVVVTADTFGSDFTAGVVPYVGDSLETLVPVTCRGFMGEVIFSASAGVTYSIQVGRDSVLFGLGISGSLSFQMTVKPPPAKGNDDFADSVLIPEPLPFTNTQNVRGATLEAGEPQSCSASILQSVWYSFTPSSDSVLTASTSGSDPPGGVGIYRGTSLGTLTSVGCDVSAPNSFAASAGVTYYFQVGTRCCSPGNLVFNLSSAPCPATGCAKVIMNVTGGVCDDPGQPSTCDVSLGEGFILSVEALAVPAIGYQGVQAYIDFGSDLIYDFNAVSAADEVVWPDCSLALKGQAVVKLDDLGKPIRNPVNPNAFLANPSSEVVSVACLSGSVPPLPVSFYSGTLFELSLACSNTETKTEVTLRPLGDPLTPAISGTGFAYHDDLYITFTIPKLSNLTINCVQPPPPVGGISLGDELASLPLDSPDDSGGSYGVVTLSIAIVAAVALLAGIGWHATRRRHR